MKKGSSRQLTRDQMAELKALADLPDDAIDTSEARELLDWSDAKRGLFYCMMTIMQYPREKPHK